MHIYLSALIINLIIKFLNNIYSVMNYLVATKLKPIFFHLPYLIIIWAKKYCPQDL